MHWFTVFLQFASFYTVASAAAWFDKRRTDIMTPYSQSVLQDVAFIATTVVRVRFLEYLILLLIVNAIASPSMVFDGSYDRPTLSLLVR